MLWYKFADFAAPKRGQMISVTWRDQRPSPPYFLVEDVDSGGGQWSARLRGQDGSARLVHSADVQSWASYRGQPYAWHQDEIKAKEQQDYEKSNKAKIDTFREANKFPDGRTLTPNMFLTVKEDAPGDLGMFAGRRLRVESVNYEAGTVSLRPFGWDEPEFEQFLKAIPVAEVMAGTSPSMSGAVEATPIKLQNGQVITERELPALTPHFGTVLENGQVTATVRVYGNYESKGLTGENRYLSDMAARGYEPGEGGYALDTTPKKYNPDGSPANLFGPYSANIRIAPPISQELIEEIRKLAPASQVRGNPKTGLVIDSKPLFMLMIDSGHHDKVGRREAEDVVAWVERNLKFSSSEESTNPEWFE